MSDTHDLDAAVESAWRRFRGRLADRLAELDDGDVLVVHHDVEVDVAEGCAPYVQFLGLDGERVDAEVSSNAFLHPDHAVRDEDVLVALGWSRPSVVVDTLNFWALLDRRQVDELAVMTVRTLREVFGVPHPSFLVAPGLEDAGPEDAPPAVDTDVLPDEHVVMPRDTEHLQRLVGEAVASFLGVPADALERDDDGDIPVPHHRSLAFVCVHPERPVVELTAHVLLDIVCDDLSREVDVLNRLRGPWRFYSVDDCVLMSYEVPALPFSPLILRIAFFRFLEALELAVTDLSARVTGRRSLDPLPDPEPEPEPADLVFAGLMELMRGRVRTATVAGLFDRDRVAIIRRLVAVRRGQLDCEEHDPDAVLDVLRRALRLVSDGVDPDRVPRKVAPRRPTPPQTALLSGPEAGEDSFELDWTA